MTLAKEMSRIAPDMHRISRRELLRVGGTGVMGVSLARLLEARDGVSPTGVIPRADHSDGVRRKQTQPQSTSQPADSS